jgi:hypothetical protein
MWEVAYAIEKLSESAEQEGKSLEREFLREKNNTLEGLLLRLVSLDSR